MSDDVSVEVIEFTDPLCTWCWGSEPVLRLETHYRGGIAISYVMGGLVEDIRGFSDLRNGIGGTPAEVTDGRLAEIPAEKTEGAVLAYLEEYRKVAPVEIATNFDMTPAEVDAIVESLLGQSLVVVVPAGNGRFIEPASDPLSCDPVTGMCG